MSHTSACLKRNAARGRSDGQGDRKVGPGLLDPHAARVEAVEVETYPRAKVVVNERTGTVVIGGDVRLQPVSILHGGLAVSVGSLGPRDTSPGKA